MVVLFWSLSKADLAASALISSWGRNTLDSLQIINEHIIPALDVVGDGFEKNKVFLPQLLMSADAAKSAFDVIKEKLRTTGQQEKLYCTVLATVHGDIHDIGKNIVKVLLENYNYCRQIKLKSWF